MCARPVDCLYPIDVSADYRGWAPKLDEIHDGMRRTISKCLSLGRLTGDLHEHFQGSGLAQGSVLVGELRNVGRPTIRGAHICGRAHIVDEVGRQPE